MTNPATNICIVCIRISDAKQVVSGSIEQTCPDCGHRVWASPASIAEVKRGGRLVCSQCVRSDQMAEATVSRAHLRELVDFLRRN